MYVAPKKAQKCDAGLLTERPASNVSNDPSGTRRASPPPSLWAVTPSAVLLRGALSLRSAHRLRDKRSAANPYVR